MNRIATCLALMILMISAVGLEAQHSQQQPSAKVSRYKKGRAVFRETKFDFGKVPQDARVYKKFYLVNEGTDTLEILGIVPG